MLAACPRLCEDTVYWTAAATTCRCRSTSSQASAPRTGAAQAIGAPMLGVVKDVSSTRYLPDGRSLFGLPVGWRSPVFRIPAGNVGGSVVDRFSCYVRLRDSTARGWNFGLIRLEAFNPDQLMALGALALSERHGRRSGDGRWDRDMASVAITEKVLRSQRPSVFNF
jgi:hypothetical protein